MKVFGERLKQLRESLGYSQIELSNELKLAHLIIPTYELNKKEPSVNHLLLFSDFFKVSVDFLLGRETKQYDKTLQMPLSELLKKYSFYFEGEPASRDEVVEAISFIKAKRMIN